MSRSVWFRFRRLFSLNSCGDWDQFPLPKELAAVFRKQIRAMKKGSLVVWVKKGKGEIYYPLLLIRTMKYSLNMGSQFFFKKNQPGCGKKKLHVVFMASRCFFTFQWVWTLRLQEAHFWEASLGSRFLAQKVASQIGFQDFKKLLLEAQEAASWSLQEACFFGFQNWLLELASWNYKHI